MANERKSESWWHTIPGVLTAAAGIITAVTGLIVALHQVGFFSGSGETQRDVARQASRGTGPRAPAVAPLGLKPAGALFLDDFSGDQLDPRWKILGHDPAKTTLQPKQGTLLIVSQMGSISGASTNLKNQYVLDLDLPSGNFEVIAKVALHIHSSHHSISIGLFKNEDNFLELIYWGKPTYQSATGEVGDRFRRTFSYVKEEHGLRTGDYSIEHKPSGSGEDLRQVMFKIERDGNQYTGFFAPLSAERPLENMNQVRWSRLGTYAWINFDGKLALWARNGNSNILRKGPPPEVAAEFDFVMIRAK